MIMFKLKHNDGKIHLNNYWIDDEFSIRYWDSKEDAQKFANAKILEGFNLEIEEVNGY